MKESRSRSTAFALAALMVLAWGACARADEETKAAPTNPPRSADRPSDDTRTDEPRIGAIAGVGFPRPLAIEALLKLGDFVAVGAEYGILPQTSIAGVDTRLWSLAADGRVFPFRGPFFIGVLAGRQHLGASATLMAQNVGSVSEQLTLDSWFVNPRIGVLWTSRAGFTFGIDAGVQIPVGTRISSSVPLSLYASAEQRVNAIGGSALPTIDLLRVGWLF
jgi:hypothetical protein